MRQHARSSTLIPKKQKNNDNSNNNNNKWVIELEVIDCPVQRWQA